MLLVTHNSQINFEEISGLCALGINSKLLNGLFSNLELNSQQFSLLLRNPKRENFEPTLYLGGFP